MILVSFLFFMLLHGRTVCNELYPISVVEDIAEKQPEWSSDNYIEPMKGKAYDQTRSLLNTIYGDSVPPLPQTDVKSQLDWINSNIVVKYKFVKEDKRDIWTKQPDFKTDLRTTAFHDTAKEVKKFFDQHNDWEKTKNNAEFRTEKSCLKLLHITAARYLLVTHILYEQSENKLIPCEKKNGKITIPTSGVCYPAPYGSATCTSDYDVGLVGKDAGILTEKFNNHFQSPTEFGKPSELVFDTNVYAFTLEFAMPVTLFTGLPVTPVNFAKSVNVEKMEIEQKISFKMRELASAYYKVFKYNEDFFNKMVNDAKEKMKTTAPEHEKQLTFWLSEFSRLNTEVALREKVGPPDPGAFRRDHNKKYQELVKEMSRQGGYKPALLGTLSKALMYAAEAYHTLGAIRFVVGGTQMKVVDIGAMTTMDLWVSIIENWGEANKEYNHCNPPPPAPPVPLEVCFLKMTKYMWRMFSAMRLVRQHLKGNAAGLVHFGEKYADPDFAMQMWLNYKKQGNTAIPKQKKHIAEFLRQFGCKGEGLGKPLSLACIRKMNDKVNAYNVRLASVLTDLPPKPVWKP